MVSSCENLGCHRAAREDTLGGSRGAGRHATGPLPRGMRASTTPYFVRTGMASPGQHLPPQVSSHAPEGWTWGTVNGMTSWGPKRGLGSSGSVQPLRLSLPAVVPANHMTPWSTSVPLRPAISSDATSSASLPSRCHDVTSTGVDAVSSVISTMSLLSAAVALLQSKPGQLLDAGHSTVAARYAD